MLLATLGGPSLYIDALGSLTHRPTPEHDCFSQITAGNCLCFNQIRQDTTITIHNHHVSVKNTLDRSKKT